MSAELGNWTLAPRLRIRRSELALLHDVLVAGLAFFFALWLCGADWSSRPDEPILWAGLPLFVLCCAISFRAFGLYRGVWRYASMRDLLAIGMATTTAVVGYLPILAFASPLQGLPWSFPVAAWLVLILLLGGPRFIYRYFKDSRSGLQMTAAAPSTQPVLLVGAGDAAERFIRAATSAPQPQYRVVGLLDEKGRRVGRRIHGIPILGNIDEVADVVEELARRGNRPKRLILTKGREKIQPSMVRQLLDEAEKLGIEMARIPVGQDRPTRAARAATALRPIEVEDLLGRPQAALDCSELGGWLRDRCILVTGAGGTIGSELCRQIAEYRPGRMVLLDNSEFNLYSIHLALRESGPALPIHAVICDVRDRAALLRVFAETRPDLVFHAAALKHVPIVEAHPCEGVLTNVIGSRNVADACREFGARAMVLISTDKAVNPGNVMGASKRIAESYCQALDVIAPRDGAGTAARRTRFMTVRFGNVLGSTGSVVPLFQRQIARGGPVTVTHPDVERYFMTVPEAVELVLQASAQGGRANAQRGKIMVLDMGRPVRILDLAEQLIRLAGLQPDRDIRVEFTGLRPGEKLSEELFSHLEPLTPSPVEGVLIASPRPVDHAILARSLTELETAAHAGEQQRVLVLIRHLVPDLTPPPRNELGGPALAERGRP